MIFYSSLVSFSLKIFIFTPLLFKRDRGGQVKPEVVIWLPRIIVLHNFLSSDECEYLKAIARPRLQVSTVVDIKTGKILDLYNTRADLRKKDHLAIDKYPLHGLRSLAVARQTVPEKTKKKKKALVIHGNSLVGCLCLILHDMIVHTPLEELQTSVSTSVITGDQLAISSETRLSSVWDQTCIHTISFSTWIRKPSERTLSHNIQQEYIEVVESCVFTVQVLCIGRGGKASKPDKRNGLLPLGGQGKCHERVSPKFTSTARLSPLLFNLRITHTIYLWP
ncbi:hypothetical protein IGI04_007508 [Brassica rapa subsp. trilocularis]|uniref:Uncharacterized protein n=1 Tax=Brassica rapa subsp. trilocularis TaxID=1813537 RepID=A0ABQ7NK20_BRACM|nr:hypothetical protein IGI04_007508 [Brassica rapa subsp. trilocularis]